jgi:hypothetical protein
MRKVIDLSAHSLTGRECDVADAGNHWPGHHRHGLLWPWLSRLGFGRLPGDIVIERENFTLYLPLMTGLIISAILSLLLWLFGR